MHIRVAALQFKPLVVVNEDIKTNKLNVGGVFGDFLNFILSKINISYSIVTPRDEQWGVKTNGNWTGMFGMIHNNQADMICGPSMITAERNQIVKFSEGLYRDDTGLLTARGVRKYFYKDILAQFNSMDQMTYLTLLVTTLSVTLFIALEMRITYLRAFWMVLKAYCYKPIKSGLTLNVSSFVLMVYSLCIVLFWININKLIGANMIVLQKDDVIDTVEEIIANKETIPTIIKGSANEYVFKSQDDTQMEQIWQRMADNGEQGLIDKNYRSDQKFIDEIIAKKRVYISGINSLTLMVIHFCQTHSNIHLIVNKNFLGFPEIMAFAFKLDFDQKIVDKFNKIIIRLKGMGIIQNWYKTALNDEISKTCQWKGRVKFCVLRAINPFNGLPETKIGLLKDFIPVFKLFIFVLIISMIVILMEIITKYINSKIQMRRALKERIFVVISRDQILLLNH